MFKKPKQTKKSHNNQNNQRNLQNSYYSYTHYTTVGNDLQTLQLTEHSLTGFMFSHILFYMML